VTEEVTLTEVRYTALTVLRERQPVDQPFGLSSVMGQCKEVKLVLGCKPINDNIYIYGTFARNKQHERVMEMLHISFHNIWETIKRVTIAFITVKPVCMLTNFWFHSNAVTLCKVAKLQKIFLTIPFFFNFNSD
jgi:hypothetical protein